MKRRALLVLAALVPLAPGRAAGPHAALPAPHSLATELRAAIAARQPLVLMVSLQGCPWCEMVRRNYLLPLRREGLPVVQLDMRSDRTVRDFTGSARTHDQLVRAWAVDSAPTLLFFGRAGQEVAPRLVGVAGDFYGGYLEQRVAQARAAVANGG